MGALHSTGFDIAATKRPQDAIPRTENESKAKTVRDKKTKYELLLSIHVLRSLGLVLPRALFADKVVLACEKTITLSSTGRSEISLSNIRAIHDAPALPHKRRVHPHHRSGFSAIPIFVVIPAWCRRKHSQAIPSVAYKLRWKNSANA